MPTDSAPGSRGPARRHDPVRPPTSPRRPTSPRTPAASRRTGPRSSAATRTAGGSYRSQWSDPALPATVWLLSIPAHRAGVPGRSEPAEEVLRGVVGEIAHRAVEAFVPAIAGAHETPVVVITRPAPAAVRKGPGEPIAPDPAPHVPPTGTPSHGATGARPAPAGIDNATEDRSDTGAVSSDRSPLGAGARLLLLDATRAGGAAVRVEDLAAVLAPGEVLAVVTCSEYVAGRFRDPRPALIRGARAAGLDYWQHIVTAAPHQDEPRQDEPHHVEPHQDERPGADRGERWRWCLVAEVSVFRRSTANQTAPAQGPGSTTTTEQVQP